MVSARGVNGKPTAVVLAVSRQSLADAMHHKQPRRRWRLCHSVIGLIAVRADKRQTQAIASCGSAQYIISGRVLCDVDAMPVLYW